MNIEKAQKFMHDSLRYMLSKDGSDLFVSAGFPPALKTHGEMTPINKENLTGEQTEILVRSIMNDAQAAEFKEKKECNFAIHPHDIGRFRVNAFIQQGKPGMVLRTITTEIPDFDAMGLPEVMREIMMEKRGLILMVGGTGSGKSTSLAAMIGQRNKLTKGHIITIEDPIEYVHPSNNSLITQREVGVDTDSWEDALHNTLRQAPDVILIGEIRERETMEHAINFAETGHLCLSTLHANSSNQALDRIINMFPEEKREQLLMDLSLNLKAIVSQRLVPRKGGGRVAAIEILINSPMIQDLIFKGDVGGIKPIMAKSQELGMQTFDQCLFDLIEKDLITEEEALRNADSKNELRLRIKLSKDGSQPEETKEKGSTDFGGLSLIATEEPEEDEDEEKEEDGL